jgi:hypothetical protein
MNKKIIIKTKYQSKYKVNISEDSLLNIFENSFKENRKYHASNNVCRRIKGRN